MIKKIIVNNPSHLATTSYKNLKDLQGNLKTISKENLEKLKQSIIKYGIFIPKFVWIEDRKNYWIEDGHQTIKALAALEKEGYITPDIPYVKVECKNKKDAAEKLLQINSRYGEINPETTFFEDFNIDLSFIENIEIPELDIKLEELESEIVEDEVPEPPTEPLSKTGDLWICGKHRILCGDATKEADILKLMDGKKVDLLLTDPPYGIDLDIKMSERQTEKDGWLSHPKKYNKIIGDENNYDPSHIFEMFGYVSEIFLWGADYYAEKLQNKNDGSWFVWDKRKGVEEMQWSTSEFELCWSKKKHQRQLVRITWSGILGTEQEFDHDSGRVHPTQKPIKLASWFLNKFSKENDIIADFFLGSGTTLIACETLNRICYGCEIDPHYIDVILDRYAKFTGDDPIRTDGVKWSELKSSIVVS